MKRYVSILMTLWVALVGWSCARAASGAAATAQDSLKVFISVDLEGIAGVVNGGETGSSGADYHRVRVLTTLEANAAVEGALEAGATEIVVRDGHGAKTNIIPELLHRDAKLLRGVTDRPENMMLGLDDSFDAVVFIGYHAKAGTDQGILAHTSSGNVIDLSVNDVSLPEAGYNAVLAGLHGVPVALVAGDNWICDQVVELFGDVVTVETKIGMGTATLALHPEVVREKIRGATAEALGDLARFEPYELEAPYTMVLKVRRERELYPGAERTATGEATFTSDDFLAVMDAFNAMK